MWHGFCSKEAKTMNKEIKNYDYRIVPQSNTIQSTYFANIYLYDAGNAMIAELNFINDGVNATMPPAAVDSYGKVKMYFKEQEFLKVIDMLRNEKPLYLFGQSTTPVWFVLTTSTEPVGEAE
jgi:hypothetical protein